jgi:hypothetical protein
MVSRPARLAVCFLLGAVLGTLLDAIHAYGDVLSYPHPEIGRLAWFVPLEFGLVGLLAGLLAPALERRFAGGAAPAWSVAERLAELALFAALYFLTTLVSGGWAIVLALALAGLALTRLLVTRSRADLPYVLPAALLGPAAEALLTALGVFDYADPDFAGIPVWLPALWANGGLLIRRLIVPVVLPQPKAARPVLRTAAGRS